LAAHSPSCPDAAVHEFCVFWIFRRMFAECLSSRLSYCRYPTKRVSAPCPNLGSGRDMRFKQQDSKERLVMDPIR
jgi:hypothetical protein